MFEKSARFYDAMYSGKDYAGEATAITALIDQLCPNATQILDVGCGPLEHVLTLKNRFHVDGVDLNSDLLDVARAKNPEGRYLRADMRDFDMEATYDVVMSLFSAIGYVLTLEGLHTTLKTFARHLKPGGLILIEPWFAPDAWTEGRSALRTYQSENLKIARLNTNRVEGSVTVMDMHYLVAEGSTVSHFVEEHRMRLSTQEEMETAFREAGQAVTFMPDWGGGRGLYVNR